MPTKRKSTVRRKKAAKRTGVKITVVDLKKHGKSAAQLRNILKKASLSHVGFVVLNAPFKVRPAKVIS